MLKNRFLVQILIMLIIGLVGANYVNVPTIFVFIIDAAMIISTVVFIIFYKTKKITIKSCFTFSLALALLIGYNYSSVVTKIKYPDCPNTNEEVFVEGFIYNKTNKYIDIKTLSGDVKKGINIRIYNLEITDDSSSPLPYHKGYFTLTLSDCPNYVKSDKIAFYGTGTVSNIIKVKGNYVTEAAYNVKLYLSQKVTDNFGDSEISESFIKAVILGDTTNISDDTYSNYGRLGITHILAVSGLHFSIIVMSIFRLLLLFRLKMKTRAIICIPFSIFYCLISGSSPSSQRALIMIIIYLAGRIILAVPDSLTSLAIAAATLLLINPYAAFGTGFILSFAATFAITISPSFLNLSDLYHRPKPIKLLNKIVQSFFITLIISMILSPILYERFGSLSLITPVSNLFLSMVFPLIMYISLIGTILSCFGMPVFCQKGIVFIIEKFHLIIDKVALQPNIAIIPTDDIIKLITFLIIISVSIALFVKKHPRELIVKLTVITFVVALCTYVLTVNLNTKNKNSIILSSDGTTSLIITAGDIYLICENENSLDSEFVLNEKYLDITGIILFNVENVENAKENITEFLHECKTERVYTNVDFNHDLISVLPFQDFKHENIKSLSSSGMCLLFEGDSTFMLLGDGSDKTNVQFVDTIILSESFFETPYNYFSLPKKFDRIYVPQDYINDNTLNYIKMNYPETEIFTIDLLND